MLAGAAGVDVVVHSPPYPGHRVLVEEDDQSLARRVAIDLRRCLEETSTLNQESIRTAVSGRPRESVNDAPAAEAVTIQG